MKKVYGVFDLVQTEKRLDFEGIYAINCNLLNCTKGDFKIMFSDDPNKYGISVSGSAEAQNSPEIQVITTPQVYSINIEQDRPYSEGLLHITLVLPKRKFNALNVQGNIMEYNIDGGEFTHINLSNKKGKIFVNIKSHHVCLFSKYYPITAAVELTGKSLLQVGSELGDVKVILTNAGKVLMKQPQPKRFISRLAHNSSGFDVNMYFIGEMQGKYTVIQR